MEERGTDPSGAMGAEGVCARYPPPTLQEKGTADEFAAALLGFAAERYGRFEQKVGSLARRVK